MEMRGLEAGVLALVPASAGFWTGVVGWAAALGEGCDLAPVRRIASSMDRIEAMAPGFARGAVLWLRRA